MTEPTTTEDEAPRRDLVRTTLEHAAAEAVRKGDFEKAETIELTLAALARIEAESR